jgi:hypothetical protein
MRFQTARILHAFDAARVLFLVFFVATVLLGGCMNPGNVRKRARFEKFFRCECVKLEARPYRNMEESKRR